VEEAKQQCDRIYKLYKIYEKMVDGYVYLVNEIEQHREIFDPNSVSKLEEKINHTTEFGEKMVQCITETTFKFFGAEKEE